MDYPKIGIRPTIDGRFGGVRESLEKQTYAMALAAKELIENNLRYIDGTKVQCYVCTTTIGGTLESYICDKEFQKENVCASLTVTPCWCYGSETMDMDPLRLKAVWGFNGTERPGAVYLAAVMAAHAQKGLPAFAIYGKDVQDLNDTTITDDVKEKILSFAKAAIAVGQMRNKSYVNIGSVSMGIMGSETQSNFFESYLGMRVEWVDMVEILRRMKLNIYDEEEFTHARAWVKENCKEGIDINAGKELADVVTKSKVVPYENEWDFVVKHYMIVRDILFGNKKLADLGWHEEAMGRNAIAGGFQGQRMWTDWLPNADFTEAIMASSFDWNGPKEPCAFATENDSLNAVSMLFIKLLTNRAPIFSDVRTYWSKDAVKRVTGYELEGVAENGIIHLINSGASALDGSGVLVDENGNNCTKEFYNLNDEDIKKMLEATDWPKANYQYFRGGGFSSHFVTKCNMPITLVRLNIHRDLGPSLQIAEGYTYALPENVSKILEDRTDTTWPTTWFVPRLGMKGFESVYNVMAAWGANHGASVYGHIGAELITLASMLRIPVALHNIEDERIFRPHSFKAFGTKDLEAQDYRACDHYGPLYK